VFPGQSVGGDRRSVAGSAVEDDRLLAVAGRLLNPLGEFLTMRLAGALARRGVVVAIDPGVLAVDRLTGIDQHGLA
jgi:hypothetical protein